MVPMSQWCKYVDSDGNKSNKNLNGFELIFLELLLQVPWRRLKMKIRDSPDSDSESEESTVP